MKISSATSVGKVRPLNEDSFYVSEESLNGAVLAVVADGMGGHNAGEVASAEAVKIIKDGINCSNSDTKKALCDAIDIANATIYKMSVKNPQLHGMGTTVTACVICENKLTAAHVGDSRLYLLRDGEIKQVTKDHSLVEMLIENGTITKEAAKSHPQKNVITRAIGTDNTVEADTYEFSVTEGDIILLCSDGLTNMVDEEKILSLVWGKKSFENLALKLIKEAEGAGGFDNITAVLIKL